MATTTMAATQTVTEGVNKINLSGNEGKHAVDEEAIESEISYMIRDPKHEHEKPYTVNYDTGGAIPRTNTVNESRQVVIHNFRPIQNVDSFDLFGFTSAKIDCSLERAAFNSEEQVKEVYYPAVKEVLRRIFPDATQIEVLEHSLRKRHAQFPIATGSAYELFQPATLVHIDFTVESAARTAQAAFSKGPDSYRRLITVNFWKSLQGPGNDWPLAFCDWRTVNRKCDTISADVVFHNRFTENERLYYSPKHKWYYFQDLGDDEVVVFRQTDSEVENGGGVPHASFNNSRADKDAPPRESIELRAYIFYT